MTGDLRFLEPEDSENRSWIEAAGLSGGGSSLGGPLPVEARRLVAVRGDAAVARLAFGARSGFTTAPGRTGYIGWYAAADVEAGQGILRQAVDRLLADGADRVIGPLDGSTWYRYRVALPREEEIDRGQPFLSEPLNPPEWVRHFEGSGFRPLIDYETRRVSQPGAAAGLVPKRRELARIGVRLRPVDMANYDADLRALYDLSVGAFAANPFYTPIPFDEFQHLYRPLRPLVDPALVRLAEDGEGRLIGYVFAFTDALGGTDRPRIVLKTLAVDGSARGLGLAAVLVDEVHAAAAERGASVLHALMQVTNASRSISRRSASELFRRYRLYGLERS